MKYAVDEIIALYKSGLTVKEIYKKVGCSRFWVVDILKKANIFINTKQTRIDDRIDLIKKMCKNGQLTYKELAQKTNENEQTIRKTVKNHKLEYLIAKGDCCKVSTEENACKVKALKHLKKSEIAKTLGLSYQNVTDICKTYNIKVKSSQRIDTLCWKCANACGGCSWSDKFKPVQDWNVTPTKLYVTKNKKTNSYIVHECPCFKEG